MANGFNFSGILTLQLQQGALRNIRDQISSGLGSANAPVVLKVDAAAATSAMGAFQGQTLKVNAAISELSTKNNELAATTRRVSDETKKAAAGFVDLDRGVQGAIANFSAFVIAASSVGLLVAAFKSAVGEAVAFERQMVRISQVGVDGRASVSAVTDEVKRLSVAWGVSSSSLAQAAVAMQNAGFAAKELKAGLEAVSKADLSPNFGGMEQATQALITIRSQFKLTAEEFESKLGGINSVSAQFGVEANDVVNAVKLTGNAFRSAGGDLNELIAVFSAVKSTSRESSESIATGLRTILVRLERPTTIEHLRQLGVELQDVKGQFVGPLEAIRRLSRAMSDLRSTDSRFSAISEELGGSRMVSKVIPLLQEQEKIQQALNIAQAGGVQLTDSATTAQSALAVQASKVKEQFLALARDAFGNPGFRSFLETGLKISRMLLSVGDAVKPLIPLLTMFAALSAAKSIVGVGRGVAAGLLPRFGKGDVVPGHGDGDTIPAMLTPGEFIIRKRSAQSLGVTVLRHMNETGDLPGRPTQMFATGGYVGMSKGGDTNQFTSEFGRLPDKLAKMGVAPEEAQKLSDALKTANPELAKSAKIFIEMNAAVEGLSRTVKGFELQGSPTGRKKVKPEIAVEPEPAATPTPRPRRKHVISREAYTPEQLALLEDPNTFQMGRNIASHPRYQGYVAKLGGESGVEDVLQDYIPKAVQSIDFEKERKNWNGKEPFDARAFLYGRMANEKDLGNNGLGGKLRDKANSKLYRNDIFTDKEKEVAAKEGRSPMLPLQPGYIIHGEGKNEVIAAQDAIASEQTVITKAIGSGVNVKAVAATNASQLAAMKARIAESRAKLASYGTSSPLYSSTVLPFDPLGNPVSIGPPPIENVAGLRQIPINYATLGLPMAPPTELPASQKIAAILKESVARSDNLSAKNKVAYKASIDAVMSRMSPEASANIAANLKGATFYNSGSEVTDKLKQLSPKVVERLPENAVVPGFYANKAKELHLGQSTNGKSENNWSVEEVHAHELTHAIDGPKKLFSKSKEWLEAWKEEPVSKYGQTKSSEGLAEFGRLLYSGQDPAALEKKFPKSAAFFKSKGLWSQQVVASASTSAPLLPASANDVGVPTPTPNKLHEEMLARQDAIATTSGAGGGGEPPTPPVTKKKRETLKELSTRATKESIAADSPSYKVLQYEQQQAAEKLRKETIVLTASAASGGPPNKPPVTVSAPAPGDPNDSNRDAKGQFIKGHKIRQAPAPVVPPTPIVPIEVPTAPSTRHNFRVNGRFAIDYRMQDPEDEAYQKAALEEGSNRNKAASFVNAAASQAKARRIAEKAERDKSLIVGTGRHDLDMRARMDAIPGPKERYGATSLPVGSGLDENHFLSHKPITGLLEGPDPELTVNLADRSKDYGPSLIPNQRESKVRRRQQYPRMIDDPGDVLLPVGVTVDTPLSTTSHEPLIDPGFLSQPQGTRGKNYRDLNDSANDVATRRAGSIENRQYLHYLDRPEQYGISTHDEIYKNRTQEAQGARSLLSGNASIILSDKTKGLIAEAAKQKVDAELLAVTTRQIQALNIGISKTEARNIAEQQLAQAAAANAKIITTNSGKVLGLAANVDALRTGGQRIDGRSGFGGYVSDLLDKVPGGSGLRAYFGSRTDANGDTRSGPGRQIAGYAALVGGSYLVDRLDRSAGTAEDAVKGGESSISSHSTTKAFSGLVQGALTGGSIGLATGNLYIAGAAALAGAAYGMASSLSEAASEIRKVQISNAIAALSENIKAFAAGGTETKQSVFDEIKTNLEEGSTKSTKENLATATGLFGFGQVDSADYFARQQQSQRENVGRLAANVIGGAQNYGRGLLKENPSLSPTDFIKRLNEDHGGKLGGLLDEVSSGTGRSRADLNEDLKKTFKNDAANEVALRNQREGDAAVNRSIYVFGRLTAALDIAANGLHDLHAQTASLSDLFSGTVGVTQVGGLKEGATQLGNPNRDEFQKSLDQVLKPFGEAGTPLRSSAIAANQLENVLGPVLARVVSSNPLEKEDYASQIRQGTRTALGYGDKQELPKDVEAALTSAISSLNKIGLENIRTRAPLDASGLAKDATSAYSSPIQKNLGDMTQALTDQANKFIQALAQATQRAAAIRQAQDRYESVSLVATRQSATFQADAEGKSHQALDLIPLSVLQRPFQARQDQLLNNGVGRVTANTPQAIGTRLAEINKQIEEKTKDQSSAKLGSSALENASKGLIALKDESARLQAALGHLANASERSAALQEKLAALQPDKDARLGVMEKLINMTPEEHIRLERGTHLANMADNSPTGMQGWTQENQQDAINALKFYGPAKLSGFKGQPIGDDVERRILEKTFPGIKQDAGNAKQEADLKGQIEANNKTAKEAASVDVKQKQAVDSQLNTILANQNDSFLKRLEGIMAKDRLTDKKIELGKAEGDVKNLTNLRDRQTKILGDVGITKDAQLDTVKGILPTIVSSRENDKKIEDNEKSYLSAIRKTNDGNPDFYKAGTGGIKFPGTRSQLRTASVENYVNNTFPEMDTETRRQLADRTVQKIENDSFYHGGNQPAKTAAANSKQFLQESLQEIERERNAPLLANRNKFDAKIRGAGQDPVAIRNGPEDLPAAIKAFAESKLSFTALGDSVEAATKKLALLRQVVDDLKKAAGRGDVAQTKEFTTGANKIGEGIIGGLAGVFATGGNVGGTHPGGPSGTDTVPAWLTPGEFVVNANSSRANKALLEHINKQKGVAMLAEGGFPDNPYLPKPVDAQPGNWAPRERINPVVDEKRQKELFDANDREQNRDADARAKPREDFIHIGPRKPPSADEIEARKRVIDEENRKGMAGEKPDNPYLPKPTVEERVQEQMQIIFAEKAAKKAKDDDYNRRVAEGNAAAFQLGEPMRKQDKELAGITAQLRRAALSDPGGSSAKLLGGPAASARQYGVSQANALRNRQNQAHAGDPLARYGRARPGVSAQQTIAEATFGEIGRQDQKARNPDPFADAAEQRTKANSVNRFGYATGGLVFGGGGGVDDIPAYLSRGEFVMSRSAVNAIGANNLANANRFASGGSVGGATPSASGGGGFGLSQEGVAALASFSGAVSGLDSMFKAFGQSSQSLSTAFNAFGGHATSLADALGKFPSTLKVENNGTVKVELNGAELLGRFTEGMKEYVAEAIDTAIKASFKERLPDA